MGDRGAGWLDLVSTFQSATLPIPPVPESLRDNVEVIERWNWGTLRLSRQAMYYLEPNLVEQLVAQPEPFFAVSHGGHGANSYALTYLLGYQRLVLVMQVGWGGAYMNNTAQAALITRLFSGCAALIDTEEQSAAANDDSRRLLCLEADLHGYAECGWIHRTQYERHFVKPGRALAAARRALATNRT